MATLTLHPSFDPGDCTVIEHTDPACPFIAEGEACDGDEARHAPCRFCQRGDKYNRADAVTVIVHSDTEVTEGNYRGDRRPPNPNAPKLTRDERIAKVEAWLASLGRKVETRDIDHENARAARDWLRRYEGDFAFLTDLRAKAVRALSDAQARGVLNCWRAQIGRPAPAAPVAAPTVDADLAQFIPGL